MAHKCEDFKFPNVNKYLPDRGEGDTLKTQISCAVCKLIYKWFNDGDVYDNTHGMSGFANDISSQANWLAEHIPGASEILDRIKGCDSEDTYTEIMYELGELCEKCCTSSEYDKPKEGSVYDCSGPYEYIDWCYCVRCGEQFRPDDYEWDSMYNMCNSCVQEMENEEDEEFDESRKPKSGLLKEKIIGKKGDSDAFIYVCDCCGKKAPIEGRHMMGYSGSQASYFNRNALREKGWKFAPTDFDCGPDVKALCDECQGILSMQEHHKVLSSRLNERFVNYYSTNRSEDIKGVPIFFKGTLNGETDKHFESAYDAALWLLDNDEGKQLKTDNPDYVAKNIFDSAIGCEARSDRNSNAREFAYHGDDGKWLVWDFECPSELSSDVYDTYLEARNIDENDDVTSVEECCNRLENNPDWVKSLEIMYRKYVKYMNTPGNNGIGVFAYEQVEDTFIHKEVDKEGHESDYPIITKKEGNTYVYDDYVVDGFRSWIANRLKKIKKANIERKANGEEPYSFKNAAAAQKYVDSYVNARDYIASAIINN